jgi:hypothetical protein
MRKLGLRQHQPMKSLIEDDYESAMKKARGQANQS